MLAGGEEGESQNLKGKKPQEMGRAVAGAHLQPLVLFKNVPKVCRASPAHVSFQAAKAKPEMAGARGEQEPTYHRIGFVMGQRIWWPGPKPPPPARQERQAASLQEEKTSPEMPDKELIESRPGSSVNGSCSWSAASFQGGSAGAVLSLPWKCGRTC